MKKRIILIGLLLAFAVEIVALIIFAIGGTDHLQDTVAVNEVVRSVQNDWGCLEDHSNDTALDYVALDTSGTVLYKTRQGLRESINMAISNRDTILDIEVDGSIVGKVIIYNGETQFVQSQKTNN